MVSVPVLSQLGRVSFKSQSVVSSDRLSPGPRSQSDQVRKRNCDGLEFLARGSAGGGDWLSLYRWELLS